MRVKLTMLAGVAAVLLPAMPAQADGVRSTSCIGSWRSVNCVTTWRKWEPQAPKPPTDQEIAESRERDRQWQALCKPVIRQDEFGVPRYVYAVAGCEYGRLK